MLDGYESGRLAIRVSCKSTELKCWVETEMSWKRNDPSWTSVEWVWIRRPSSEIKCKLVITWRTEHSEIFNCNWLKYVCCRQSRVFSSFMEAAMSVTVTCSVDRGSSKWADTDNCHVDRRKSKFIMDSFKLTDNWLCKYILIFISS